MAQTKTQKETLTLSLLENAESFLLEAVGYVERDHASDPVFAVVHLATALELTLKAVLRDEHWTLICEDVTTASKRALVDGTLKTVSFTEAVRRCREIVSLELEEKDWRYLKDLQQLRNAALHYEVNVDVGQAKGVVARGFNIFNHIYTKQLKQGEELPAEISARLAGVEAYVRERMRRLRHRLRRARKPVPLFRDCGDCGQPALVRRSDDVRCLFCGSETTAFALAHRGEGAMGPCGACGEGHLAFVLLNNDDGGSVCVLCGYQPSGSHYECSECGESFWEDPELSVGLCTDCVEYKISRD